MHIVRAGAVLLGLFFATLVHATAQRTFVSTAGVDNPACSLVAPCRAFAAAITATSPGGEVIALDSGGYGPVTITKSVSIIAPAGVYAGISVFSGNGVTVNGSAIAVVLRGLTINGQGGNIGISFLQGASLAIEDCTIDGLANIGISLTAPNSKVRIKNAVVSKNSGGVAAVLNSAGSMNVTVANSLFAGNGVGAEVLGNLGSVTMTVTHSIFTDNVFGLEVSASAGQVASIFSDGNTITFALGAAFKFLNGGGAETIFSPGNNAAGYTVGPVDGGTLTSCCAL